MADREPVFEARSVGVSYRQSGKAVAPFADVSMRLMAGRVYDLVGPSGSGKSTLIGACARLLPRTGGELYLKGRPSAEFAPEAWRREVCLVPQTASLVPGTVRDNLLLPFSLKVNQGRRAPGDDELLDLLRRADLPDVALDRDARQLSGGQQARVALLRVFAARPAVLLLDEVDAALDDDSAADVGGLVHGLVDGAMTCLRIRHRAADGHAFGTFTLAGGALTYEDNPATDKNRPRA